MKIVRIIKIFGKKLCFCNEKIEYENICLKQFFLLCTFKLFQSYFSRQFQLNPWLVVATEVCAWIMFPLRASRYQKALYLTTAWRCKVTDCNSKLLCRAALTHLCAFCVKRSFRELTWSEADFASSCRSSYWSWRIEAVLLLPKRTRNRN